MRSRSKNKPFFKVYKTIPNRPDPIAFYELNGHEIQAHQIQLEGFSLPVTPSFTLWNHRISRKIRCPDCYRNVRGQIDFKRHRHLIHGKGDDNGTDTY